MGLRARVVTNVTVMHTGRAKWSFEMSAEAHAPANVRWAGEPRTAAPMTTNSMGEAARHAASRIICGGVVPVRSGASSTCKAWEPAALVSHRRPWHGKDTIIGGMSTRKPYRTSSARSTPAVARGQGA